MSQPRNLSRSQFVFPDSQSLVTTYINDQKKAFLSPTAEGKKIDMYAQINAI
jgi:hypothetical protein